MKKIFSLLLCLCIIASCDDGDVDLPAFNFDETVYSCDLIFNDYTLFRLGGSESLVVTLSTNEIKNEVTETPIEVSINENNVIYRTFNDKITSDYFCSPIPPISPSVSKNWTGVSGSASFILIKTAEAFDEVTDELIGYTHTITFQNLKLQNGNDFIIYEEDFFGEFFTEFVEEEVIVETETPSIN